MKFFCAVVLSIAIGVFSVNGQANFANKLKPFNLKLSSASQIYSHALMMSRMAKASGDLTFIDCYDYHLPRMSAVNEETKQNTNVCQTTADSQKTDALALATRSKNQIDSDWGNQQDSWNNCKDMEVKLDGLTCYSQTGQTSSSGTNKVATDSRSAINKYDTSVKSADFVCQNCIFEVSEDGRKKSETEWNNLQYCIDNGEIFGTEQQLKHL